MIRASSHRELPHGLGGSMTGKRGIGFRENQTPDRRATEPQSYSTTRSTEPPAARFSVPKVRKSLGSHRRCGLVGGPAMRTGTSEPRYRAS
jgi:hypothetical protein